MEITATEMRDKCVAMLERWANEGDKFDDQKAIVYRNTCRSAARAIALIPTVSPSPQENAE